MVQLGACNRLMITGLQKQSTPHLQLLSGAVMEDNIISEGVDDYETTDSMVKKKTWKRKRHRSSEVKRGKAKRCRSLISAPKIDKKKLTHTGRWSTIRYEQGEESILKIMKANGAVFGNPISRQVLRSSARKHIGDTGLLDHLLKHMDGKVAPGGTERFRRRHSFTGQMEYWLESADLVKIREDAGVEDPFWVPPPGWKPGSSECQDPVAATELKLLKEEMARMKREMKELISKKQGKDHSNASPNSYLINQRTNFDSSPLLLQDMQKDLMKWKSKITKQLIDISSSLSCMQDVCADLETWKAKIEQKMTDITNSLSIMQGPKQYNTFSPSVPESWQDLFGSTDLITQQGSYTPWFDGGDLIDLTQGNLAPWLDCSDLVKIEPETTVQDLYLIPDPGLKANVQQSACSDELEVLREEMSKMKRDIQDVMSKKQDEEEANLTPDSSLTTDSNLDLDNSLQTLQEMYTEVVNWKAKIDQQLTEISNVFGSMEASSRQNP